MATKRTTKILLLAVLVTGMVITAFFIGVGATWLLLHGSTAAADEADEFGVFWEAWHLVEGHFFGDLPDMQHVTWAAIRGALSTLDDPHTTFLEPQPRQREREELSGKFGGIGAYVTQAEDGSIVLDPMPDLPAEQAGIQKGDILVQVDDTEIAPDMTAEDVAALIRGEIGTVVHLTLRREGQAVPIVVEIERQEIPSASVEWQMIEQAEGVGYVRIGLFGSRTAAELTQALEELQAQGMTHLVVDLRGNGGGLFDAAINTTSRFLRSGVVVYQLDKDGSEQAFAVRQGPVLEDTPLVLLVDGGTASASEIMAGALQDLGRAALIGEKTYGKGSVQKVFDLSDGSSVHITAAKWLTPDHHQIDGQGLTPDVEITISEEDRTAGRDPQLDRAIQYLLNGQ